MKTRKFASVFSILDNKMIFATRENNQTLTLKKTAAKRCLIDSNKAMLEDKRGYRYSRQTQEETELNSDRWIYRMI